jgi:hypothetical protein
MFGGSMSKSHDEYRASVTPKVSKILSDIDKLTKFSLSKDYDLEDVKQINDAIKKASVKMQKTLTNNLQEDEAFKFNKSATAKANTVNSVSDASRPESE